MPPKIQIKLKSTHRLETTVEKEKIRERERSVERNTTQHKNYREREPITIHKHKKAATTPIENFISNSTSNESNKIEQDEERGRKRTKKQPKSEPEEVVQEDNDMMAMMGFGGFGSTKNKKVKGTDVSGVKKKVDTSYRQYINRKNGFNRALSPSRKQKS